MTTADAAARAASLSCWTDPSVPVPLHGGITNHNFVVEDQGRRFVVRIGEDIPVHGILRWHEVAVSRAAEAAGIAPRVYHQAPGALVLDYVEARPLTEADVRDPARLPALVALIRAAHYEVPLHLRGPVLSFWVFHVLRDYAARLAEDGSAYAARLDALCQTAQALETATGAVEMVLGHNDLLPGNILDDGARLWLIDWEYAGVNTPLFDLAGLATNNGLTEPAERQLLELYDQAAVTDRRWRAYSAMKCASLMRETMWSMVAEIHSDVDFDYAAYTAENSARLDAALADFQNT